MRYFAPSALRLPPSTRVLPSACGSPRLPLQFLRRLFLRNAFWAPLCGLVFAALAGLPARGAEPPANALPPANTIIVHTDAPAGRLVSDTVTNATVEAIYAQATDPLADSAFQWVRATNALSYVRCYNWLGDGIPKGNPYWFSGCRVARAGPNGQPVYQWEGLERVLDTLVASGVKPMIVCGGLPDPLCAGPIQRNEGGQAANHPKDYAQYQDMLVQMFRRLEKTYSAPEVRSWYFEVWSQPDHEGSWLGARAAPFVGEVSAESIEPFTRLYDHFVAASLVVDPKLHIGGPGLAGDISFLQRFLEHCTRGTNSATGKPGARIDFISWQRYGTVADILRWNSDLRGMVEKDFPELRRVQFVLSECGSGPVEGARAPSGYEAARMAALLDGNARAEYGVDFMFRAGDLVDSHFDGYRSLITRIGRNTVPTPAFRLYMLLSKLGGERLRTEPCAGVGVLAAHPPEKGRQNSIQALIYRYDPSVLPGEGEPEFIHLRFVGLPAPLLRLPMRVYRIDAKNHSPYEAWLAAGSPRPSLGALPEPLAALGRELAGNAPLEPDQESNGIFINNQEATVDLRLPPNAVALVTLGAEPAYETKICPRGERIRKAEEDYSEAASLARGGNLEKSLDALRKISEKYADTSWREIALYSMIGLYEVDRKSPADAETVRRELLQLPLDDLFRLRQLERLRVDAVRNGDLKEVARVGNEVEALQHLLDAERRWPLHRYPGQ